jgi:hypothetical protein
MRTKTSALGESMVPRRGTFLALMHFGILGAVSELVALQLAQIDSRVLQNRQKSAGCGSELVMKVRARLSRSMGRPHTDVAISLQCLWKVSKTTWRGQRARRLAARADR